MLALSKLVALVVVVEVGHARSDQMKRIPATTTMTVKQAICETWALTSEWDSGLTNLEVRIWGFGFRVGDSTHKL